MNEHGITEKHIRVSETAIRHVITHYTRKAGVRNLEREGRQPHAEGGQKVAEGKAECHAIDHTNLNKFLGVAKFVPEAELEKMKLVSPPASRGPKAAVMCCISKPPS